LRVDRGRAEGRVPELALDHVEHHVLACELYGVSVAQLHRVAVAHFGSARDDR
jgi:hypothetical protein